MLFPWATAKYGIFSGVDINRGDFLTKAYIYMQNVAPYNKK